MPFFDMPLDEMRGYKPERNEPSDFDDFWKRTLNDARQHDLNVQFEQVDYGMRIVDTYDVTFAGYGGQAVKGWFIIPNGTTDPLPCMVVYIGYGGGRGFPTNWLLWANAGYATLVMDTRGQGSAWLHGDTPDVPDGANPHFPGFMTQGILDPETYYYRRVFTDGVRAVEAAQSHELVDAKQIALTGGSQGGAITIAVSGLLTNIPVSMPDVPFLCHFERAIGLTDSHPYEELVRYLKIHRDKEDTVYHTLSYFDCMNFAARSRAKTLYSTSLMDTICPPSTVFAAYNQVEAEKDIKVYRFNHHEGGATHHDIEKVKFLHAMWG